MEQQFILRLPENLRNSDPKDFKMVKKTQKEISFYIKDKEYPGIICKLPTIIETQKCIDNKLYKIADLSTLVVVYEDDKFVVEDEIKKHESSGLTPPMNFVKERKFSSVCTIRTEEIEEIERKVAELLLEDSKAMKVEILTNEKDSSDVDLDLFAAEIENDLPVQKKAESVVNNKIAKSGKAEVGKRKDSTADVSARSFGDETEESDSLHKNIHMKDETQDLHQSHLNVNELANNIGMEEISAIRNEGTDYTIGYSAESIVVPSGISEVENANQDSILLDLENKIAEKQELYNKAVNPILKKRFEHAISELKASYEQRKKEIDKK